MILRLLITTLCLCLSMTAWGLDEFSNVSDNQPMPVVGEHEITKLIIPFQNPFDRAIRIVRKDSTCACLELETSKEFLLPYEEAELTFAVPNTNTSGIRTQRIWLEVSDPDLPRLAFKIQWQVQANVTVDSIPETGPFDQRPEGIARRDVYGYTTHRRPDEPQRLRKLILFDSPDETAPEGGLQITQIDYAGEIWSFEQKQFENGKILVIARAANPDVDLPIVQLEEMVEVHTNHPIKPLIQLTFYTAIDSKAGRPDTIDPWGHLR